MKKLFKILMLAVVALTLICTAFACSGQNSDGQGSQNNQTPAPGLISGKLPEYEKEHNVPYGELPDLDGVVIDGKLDDQLWEGKKWYSSYEPNARVGLFVTSTTSDKGLYVAAKSTDRSVFWTYRNHFEVNTNIQIHIKTDAGDKTFAFDANNIAPNRYSVNSRTYVDGKINLVGQAYGLCAEFFATWQELGFKEKPDSVFMLPLYNYKESETKALKTLFPTFQKMLTGGYDDYYEFGQNGSVIGDDESATVGNHEIGLGKTNVWTVEADEQGYETVSANGAKRIFGQAIFFREEEGNYFKISARIKAKEVSSTKARAGLLIYNDNISYRAAAVEISDDCYSDGELHTVKLSGYTDFPRGTTITTEFATVENKKGDGRAQDEVDLTLYYMDGKVFYIVNDKFVYSETVTYLNNCYMGLYSFNSSAQFTNLDCMVYDNREEVEAMLADYVYMIDVVNHNEAQARVDADKLCVAKDGDKTATLSFTCAEGYTVGELYLTLSDGSEQDIIDDALEKGSYGKYALEIVNQNVIVNCVPTEIEQETVDVKLSFYNADDGEDKGRFSSAEFTLTGEGVFTNYAVGEFSADYVFTVSVPKGYCWSYKTTLNGFRSSKGSVLDGAVLNQSMDQPQLVRVIQNVIGGVASDKNGQLIVSSNPGSIWDMSNEENDEVYFQTANNKHTTVYFSGKTVSDYHVAYVEITNQTDPLAFTSLERDPAVGFVFQTGRYEQEGKAMLRFAGMRIVPDGVWANKLDTGNIFSGYTGYDIKTNKGVIDGEPYLAGNGTVNRLSYAGREDTTSFLMIRADEKVYFYIANGSRRVTPDGNGFDNLTYLFEYEHEAFGGNAAIGIGATVSYNLRLKFANYWLLSGDEARQFADGKITSTLKVKEGEQYLSFDSAGMYATGEGEYKVSSDANITVKAKDVPEGKIVRLTYNDRIYYLANGERATFNTGAKNSSVNVTAEAVEAITISGKVKDYNQKTHGSVLNGFAYSEGVVVKRFSVKDGEFTTTVPKGEGLELEIGVNQYLSERIDLSTLGGDANLGDIEVVFLPVGGSVRTDGNTTIGTQAGYEYAYDSETGATAHIRVNSATNIIHTLAIQSESKANAVVKFTYSRKSAAVCGSNVADEGALGVGFTVSDGKTLRTMALIRKGYRIYGNNNVGYALDNMNENVNPYDFSPITVDGMDVMIVKEGSTFYGLCKPSTEAEYAHVYTWVAQEDGVKELAGKVNFGITFTASKGRFVDFTVTNVSVEDYVVGEVAELISNIDCGWSEDGAVSITGNGVLGNNGAVYSVKNHEPVTVTVTPDENNVISAIYVGEDKITLDDYVDGAYSFEYLPKGDAEITVEYVSLDSVCKISGTVAFDGDYSLLSVSLYDARAEIGSAKVESDGTFVITATKGTEAWIDVHGGLYRSAKTALGTLEGHRSVGELTVYKLPFGGTVQVGNVKINTQACYEYSVNEDGEATAHIRVDSVSNLIHTLALDSEAKQNAVIKFSYSRKSASQCGASASDEGAIGIGISVTDGQSLRTLLLIKKGYRVLANNNNGTTIDKMNEVHNNVDIAKTSVERVDVTVVKRGSQFFVLCKDASAQDYAQVFSWTAEDGGLAGASKFAITFMASRTRFVDVTFSSVSVEDLNESDFPQLFA